MPTIINSINSIARNETNEINDYIVHTECWNHGENHEVSFKFEI